MSKPRNDWWSNAVNTVRNYPARKQEYEELKRQSFSGLSGLPSSGTISNPTEQLALREMPPMKQREYDAVTQAINVTLMMPDGDTRMTLIREMYWKGQKRNISDVINSIGIAEATGKRWHGAFILLVGECLGYIK